MKTIKSPSEMQTTALELRQQGKSIALVPTMGYLHEGHLSLVRLARKHGDVVVVSIFVNPTQFGPGEDFSKYPRDFKRDEDRCRKAGVDFIFYPPAKDMYAPDHSVFVVEENLSRDLCGAARPGHFRGVATVVAKLFNLVLPHAAVFGEKDAQQLRIIERMVRDLDFPVHIVRGPTVREPDGLAMSSRNAYLSPDERKQALCLKRALDRAVELYRTGERDPKKIAAALGIIIAREPAAKIDYVKVVDDATLAPIAAIERPALVALAVFVGKTRLIDNVVLTDEY